MAISNNTLVHVLTLTYHIWFDIDLAFLQIALFCSSEFQEATVDCNNVHSDE